MKDLLTTYGTTRFTPIKKAPPKARPAKKSTPKKTKK